MAVAVACYSEIVIKPFPFLHVYYTQSADEWDGMPEDLPIDLKVSIPKTAVPDRLAGQADALAGASFDQKVVWGAKLSHALQSISEGNALRGADDIFSKDHKFKRICSEASKIFVAAMSLVGVPARVVWMQGHTVAEAHDGDKWVLIDTDGNVRGFDKRGRPLSLSQIIQGGSEIIYKRVLDKSIRDRLSNGYLESDGSIYKSQKLAVVLRGEDIYGFEQRAHDIGAIVKSATGLDRDAVAYSMQLLLTDPDYKVGNFGVGLTERLNFEFNMD